MTDVLVYLDYIITLSNDMDQPLKHVRQVMAVLQDAESFLKLKECQFCTEFIKNIVQITRPRQLSIEHARVKSHVDAEPISTERKLFVGFMNVH